MNERIKQLAEQADIVFGHYNNNEVICSAIDINKFAELIAKECADICLEMATKCAGISDGTLAKDCAYWIKKDFGVKE